MKTTKLPEVNTSITEPVILRDESNRIETIVVHAGEFHVDDVAIVALVKSFHNPNVKIIRTDDISKIKAGNGTLIADIGRKMDGKWLFDHHQFRYTNPADARSCIGLFWDTCGNVKKYVKLTKYIREIDMHDTGLVPNEMCYAIRGFAPLWYESSDENINAAFFAAVDHISIQMQNVVKHENAARVARKYIETLVNEGYASVQNEAIILPKNIPWQGYAVRNELQGAIYPTPAKYAGAYTVQLVGRRKFPEAWLRKESRPDGIIFINSSRYIANCESMDIALGTLASVENTQFPKKK